MSKSPCLNVDGTPKRAYKGRKAALRFARRTNHDTDDQVAPYLCADCGRWHNGTFSPDFRERRDAPGYGELSA